MNSEQIEGELKNTLDENRYNHCLGVAQVAVEIGKLFQTDAGRLRIAGLLHDAGKSMHLDEQVRYARRRHLHLSKDDRKAEGVIHAIVGSDLARVRYGIRDREILRAIRDHTTGRGRMTTFEKIIFAADYLDPNRGLEANRDVYRLIQNDFDAGILEIAKRKLIFVLEKGDFLHPLSVEFYNSQLRTVSEQKKLSGKPI